MRKMAKLVRLKLVLTTLFLFFAFFVSLGSCDYVCVPAPIDATLICPEKVSVGQDISVTLRTTSLQQSSYVKGKLVDVENKYTIQDGVVGTYSSASGGFTFLFDAINEEGKYQIIVSFLHPVTNEKIERSCNITILPKIKVSVGSKSNIHYINEDLVLYVSITPSSVKPSIKVEFILDEKPVSLAYSLLEKGGNNYEILVKSYQFNRPGVLNVKVSVSDISNAYEPGVGWKFGINLVEPEIGVQCDFPDNAKVGDTKTIKIITTDVKGNAIDVESLRVRITYPSGGTGETLYKKDFMSFSKGVYETTYTFKYGQNYYFEVTASAENFKPGRCEANVAVTGGPVCGCDTTPNSCDAGCPCDPACQESSIPILPLAIGGGAILLFIILRLLKK